MGVKYHKLKNFMIATAAAALYQGYIAPDVPVLKEIFSVLYVFGLMMFLLGESDLYFSKRRKAKREERMEMKMSASDGNP